MSVVRCPLCGYRVNSATTRCPECSADLSLDRDAAFDELIARSGPPSLALSARRQRGPLLTRWRASVLIVLAIFAAVVFSSPHWAGYFGPRAAVYATFWRPWQAHLELIAMTPSDPPGQQDSERLVYDVFYWDGHGNPVDLWVTVARSSPSSRWRVVSSSPVAQGA